MTADDDDLDPSTWLAAQFGEEPPKPVVAPKAAPPVADPPAAAPPFAPPPLVAPATALPPAAPLPELGVQPPWPASPMPPVTPQPAAPPGGFSWSLTPGEQVQPTPPVEAGPPSALPWEPAQPSAGLPAVEPPTVIFPAADPTTPLPSFGEPGGFPGQSVEPVAPDPSRWLAAPLDPALDGVTEVFEAELVGLTDPQGEGLGASPLDDLFGDGQFRDFSDEPLISPPPRQPGAGGRGNGGGAGKPPTAPRAPIPRNQKILMSIAGGLVAALALVALFAVGTKLPSLAPAPVSAPTATPTPTASSGVRPVGPVKPGDYHWDQLLGGECLEQFTSAWQDEYTVVDCTTAHPAQLVFRGTFTDPASATYPGVDELQKRINLLCTPATIINYAVAGTVQDIQVQASYAPDEDDWDKGNHDFFCFVNRSGGGDLTASVAIQQVPVTPTPTPTATTSNTPGAPVGRGHAGGTKPAP